MNILFLFLYFDKFIDSISSVWITIEIQDWNNYLFSF